MSLLIDSPYDVIPVAAFQDNYLWLICNGRHAVVVDPGDAVPVEAALRERNLTLGAIVLTHHHRDHVGGVSSLVHARPGQSIDVYGPASERIEGITHPLRDGENIHIPAIDVSFTVLAVPGHTRGHIAYFGTIQGTPVLFCGDTLFAGGCGRLFEGTAEQMQHSLARLMDLPGNSLVFCAHEYTLGNLRFALAVDPENEALRARVDTAKAARAAGEPTVPSTILLERQTNPFVRWDDERVRAAAELVEPGASRSAALTFGALRRWKDRF